MEPPNTLSNSLTTPCISNNLPLVSLISSSSTSSSCTQLAETSSSHSNEIEANVDDIDETHVISKGICNNQEKLYKTDYSVYIDPEMNKPAHDDKRFYGKMSDAITEPLLAINCVGAKIYSGADDGNTEKPLGSIYGLQNTIPQGKQISPTRFSNSGHKKSDTKVNSHKNSSTIDYNNEALKLDKTRNAWSPSNVRKTSQHNERRHSISSEESLSDYEELGGTHTAINGGIGSHKNRRYGGIIDSLGYGMVYYFYQSYTR